MILTFYKYHGAGNDFILFDNRNAVLPRQHPLFYASLCHRRFGIGADGVMLLQNHAQGDFEMVYYNADGHEGSLCGNGGRCMVAFAHLLKVQTKKANNNYYFLAADGWHYAQVLDNKSTGDINEIQVALQMANVTDIKKHSNTDWELNTGSPHYVKFVEEVQNYPVIASGKAIRNSPAYIAAGINVNFVEPHSTQPNYLKIRTYERGVEDETWACGTGVTAAALAADLGNFLQQNNLNSQTTGQQTVLVQANGGLLQVQFEKQILANGQIVYANIWLICPAAFVFKGQFDAKF